MRDAKLLGIQPFTLLFTFDESFDADVKHTIVRRIPRRVAVAVHRNFFTPSDKRIRQKHTNSGTDEVALPLSFTGTDLSVPIRVHGNEWTKELVNVHGGVSPKIDVPDVPMDAKCSIAAVDAFAYQQGVVARFELVLAHPLITISLISFPAVSTEILVPVWDSSSIGQKNCLLAKSVLLSSILSCISFVMVEEVSELEDETGKDFAEHLCHLFGVQAQRRWLSSLVARHKKVLFCEILQLAVLTYLFDLAKNPFTEAPAEMHIKSTIGLKYIQGSNYQNNTN